MDSQTILKVPSHLRLVFTSGLSHSGFSTKINLEVLFGATSSTHVTLLDTIALIISGEE
jgi:hypothetical protein